MKQAPYLDMKRKGLKRICKIQIQVFLMILMVYSFTSCIKDSVSVLNSFSGSVSNSYSGVRDGVSVNIKLTATSETAKLTVNLDGDPDRLLNVTILFDGNATAFLETVLPYSGTFSWDNLSEEKHTITVQWIGKNGEMIQIPLSFQISTSIYIGN